MGPFGMELNVPALPIWSTSTASVFATTVIGFLQGYARNVILTTNSMGIAALERQQAAKQALFGVVRGVCSTGNPTTAGRVSIGTEAIVML